MIAINRHARQLLAIALLGAAPAALAETEIADIRQGTNLAVAISPDGTTLVVDLLAQLWSLPATGGGAVPLTPPGEPARQPRFSPDGRLVVYQRLVNGQWDIWMLDLGTGAQRALVATPADEREPDFGPDGQSVVFAANRTGHYTLWSVRIADGVETQLTEEPGDASFPSVAENGLIAYVVDDDRESTLRVLRPTGVSTAVHTSTARLSAPTWRPGGGVIVFGERSGPQRSQLGMLVLGEPRVLKPVSGNEDIFRSRLAWRSTSEFIYASDGQLWRRALAFPTREAVHLFAAAAVETAPPPAASPPIEAAESRAAGINGYTRSPDGRRATFTALGDLWLVERGQLQRLTDDSYVDLDPTFAPDGDSIVFASERSGQFELWRVTLRDRRFSQITFGAHRPHLPAVSPNGREIAFVETDGLEPLAATRVNVLTLASGAVMTVAEDVVGAQRPTWSADGGLTVRARSARRASQRGGLPRVEWLQPLSPPDPASAEAATGDEDEPPLPDWRAQPAPPDYVLRVGRLFDGVRDDYRRHVDVHVRGGRIAAIVGRGVLPTTETVIDRLDATLIPGFVDVHAHQTALAGERLGRAWLAYGVTTVRELAPDTAAATERAESWASGRMLGPRLVVTAASPRTGGTAAAPIAHGFAHSLAQQVRTLAVPRLPAGGRGIDAFGFAPTRYELELSPGFTVYQDGLSRLIASGTFLSPGLAALAGYDSMLLPAQLRDDRVYDALFSGADRGAWSRPGPAAVAVPALQQTVTRLIRGGARVAIGSDAPSVPFGLGFHRELALLAEAGLANDQVLRLATAGGALALGLEQQLGTLEEGKLADFVVIDGDPLARITDTLRITAVAKGGHWFERGTLLEEPR